MVDSPIILLALLCPLAVAAIPLILERLINWMLPLPGDF